jgi:hypothetical protein
MARDVDRRGGRRWVLLFVLVAGIAWIVWSRRSTADVALGNIGAVGAPTLPPTPRRVSERPVPAAVEPEPEPDPDPGPELPGAAAPLPDGSAPGPGYTIKGNAGSMLFHLPSSPYYARTKPALWFRTAEDARAAGFTEWKPKRRATNN